MFGKHFKYIDLINAIYRVVMIGSVYLFNGISTFVAILLEEQ